MRTPKSQHGLDGILNLNKPPGVTSMEVVRQVKRLTRQKGVGHGGTLDPLATGILLLCFGQATRVMEYLVESSKLYRASLRLGVTTDTYDAEGTVLHQQDASGVDRQQFLAVLNQFTGTLAQTPPMYSALKFKGKRLYDLARRGEEVPRTPRRVQVFRMELLEFHPPEAVIEVDAGRGLYIRSLVHDLGQALGCGAHLTELVRVRLGPFHIGEASGMAEFQAAVEQERWPLLLHPLDAPLLSLRAAVLDRGLERRVRQGQPIPARDPRAFGTHLETCRLYSADGDLVALARFDRGRSLWQPRTVFARALPLVEEPT